MRIFLIVIAVLSCGCESRSQKKGNASGTLAGQPFMLSYEEKQVTESGPDISKIVGAAVKVATGDIMGAVGKLSERTDSRLEAFSGDITNTQIGAGGGLMAMLMPMLLQFLKQKKTDKELDDTRRRELELAKAAPPDR